jgi:transglutaminase superfamily protein
MRATFERIDDGTPGVVQKLVRLRDLVETSKRDPQFRQLAAAIVRNVKQGDFRGELAAISSWVQKHVTYRRDPVGLELFVQPDLLARQALDGIAVGDCDDHVGLGAALAEVLGHPSRFVVGGYRDRVHGATWSHIWRQSLDGRSGRWLDFDDTAKRRPFGFSPAARFEVTMVEPERGAMQQRTIRVGVPVLDRFGQPIPGRAQLAEMTLGGDGLAGIGKRLKKAHKKHLRVVKKVVKKALPVVALAANVIPGVGQVASAALLAAAAAQRQAQAKKRAKQQQRDLMRDEQAAYQAEQAAQQQQEMIEQTQQGSPLPMPPALVEQQAPLDQPAGVSYEAQPMQAYEQLPPPEADYWEPPPPPPQDPWWPAWDEGIEQSALAGLSARGVKDEQLAGIFDFLNSPVVGQALTTVAGVATTGTLTVGGVSVPLGRTAQRLVRPIQRYASRLRPTIVTTPPPTGQGQPYVPPAPEPARQALNLTGIAVALGVGGALLLLLGRRR